MQENRNLLYNRVKDLITKKEFNEKIKDFQKEYDNLYDEETAALFIVDELGRNQQNTCKINEIEPGMECSIFCKVTNIRNTRTFSRKNGSSGRVVNLEISDETGSCGLALWDKDVELIKNKTIKIGSNIKIVNGYIKDGYNGLEINVGKWSIIETNIKEDLIKNDIQQFNSNTIKGKIICIEPTKAFFKDNGDYGFQLDIKIKNENGIKNVCIWDEKVKEIQKFKNGELIEIKNFNLRQKNGKTEIHLNGNGKIKKI